MASGLPLVALLLISSICFVATARIEREVGLSVPFFCDSGWTRFGSRCFIFYYETKTWSEAEEFCISIGGNLASVRSSEENKFLNELVKRQSGHHYRTWVGGYDAVKDGQWMWTDGTVFDYTEWASGEPNNYRGRKEDCLEINYAVSYWNDESCTAARPFLCAKSV